MPDSRSFSWGEINPNWLSPIKSLVENPRVTEIAIVEHDAIFAEIDGTLRRSACRFSSPQDVLDLSQRLVSLIGRELSVAHPYADGRLLSPPIRVTAMIPPLSSVPVLNLRKHTALLLRFEDLIADGTATTDAVELMIQKVHARANIVVSGPTGAGKTTALRMLASCVPEHERLISIEETMELQLGVLRDNVVCLETRTADAQGDHGVSMDLSLTQALHMRPDRIILGELRHAEALNLLVAMGTGHDGAMTTVHANNARSVPSRLLFMMQLGRPGLAASELLELVGDVVDVILHVSKDPTGKRLWKEIVEVEGSLGHGPQMNTLYLRDGLPPI